MLEWPTTNDYTIAIQNPHLCFKDAVLSRAAVEKHPVTRMPKVWTGNFAQVYELRHGSHRWAVKCFTRSAEDVRKRYAAIAQAIQVAKLPYFVDFSFLPDEMLVNGRRYPVVKMAWVDGISLDKYVETNLFRPDALLQLAAQILKMVRDLEAQGLAHGDLQHGNILLQGQTIRLVDYDGMYVPTFAETAAPELGLPSYQHPRREPRLYGPSLDRFSLLVICTGLTALAAEPGLWYEFSTGDNLLFRREDFGQPRSSEIFARLRQSSDQQVVALTETLATACLGPPGSVPLPTIEFDAAPVRRVKPWWVTEAPPVEKAATLEPSKRSWQEHLAAAVARVEMHRSFAASCTVLIGLWGIAVFRGLDPGLVGLLSAITTAAYVSERTSRFRRLPAAKRRKELAATIATLRHQIKDIPANKTKLQEEVARLAREEAREKGEALRRLQEDQLTQFLRAVDVAKMGEIKGIGPAVIANFRAVGIYTFADLRQRNIYSVRGVGPKRYSQIRDMASRVESEAKARVATTLPSTQDAQITQRYQHQRRNAVDQLTALDRRSAALNAQFAQAEREYALLHVPGFFQFLRHNL